MGPTASGKSDLALGWPACFRVRWVQRRRRDHFADALQLYRGMDVEDS